MTHKSSLSARDRSVWATEVRDLATACERRTLCTGIRPLLAFAFALEARRVPELIRLKLTITSSRTVWADKTV